jgi:nitroreductase
MNVQDALRERRSISFFDSDKAVEPALLNEVLALANLAPSSYNLQPWEVIVVASAEKKKLLRQCAFNQAKVEEAPAVLIVLADTGAVEKHIDAVLQRQVELGYLKSEAVESARKPPFSLYGDADSVTRKIFAAKNASFFAMSFMAAARGFGLETHPMDGFDDGKIREAFAIPERKIIPLLIAVGYPRPGVQLLPRGYRRALDEFVTTI